MRKFGGAERGKAESERRNVGASERRSVGAESGWSRRGSNHTSNEMAMVRDADDGWSQVDVHVHHVHHAYITHTLRVHCAYVACVSLYITCRCEGCRWAKVWWWQRAGKRKVGKAERREGGVGAWESGAERKCRNAECSQGGSPYNHPPSRKATTRCLGRERDRAERD